MLYIKDATFGNPAMLLCEILLASALRADCIKHIVYLFICLGRSQREQAVEVTCDTALLPSRTGGKAAREGPEPRLLGNLTI